MFFPQRRNKASSVPVNFGIEILEDSWTGKSGKKIMINEKPTG